MQTLDTIKLLYQAFQQNPTRLSYSTKTLCKQFAAEEQEVRQARKLYRLNPNDFIVAQALDTDLVYDSIPASELFEVLTGNKSYELGETKLVGMGWTDKHGKDHSYIMPEQDQWEVKQKWIKGKEGSQLWVRKESQTDFKDEFEQFVNSYKFQSIPEYTQAYTNKLAVVCLFDIHLGKIAYKHYTGNVDNLTEQSLSYTEEFIKLIDFLKRNTPEQIYFPIGNDLFNVDNPRLETVKGTYQDSDHDLHGMFKLGLELMTMSIDALSRIAPTKIILVPGNHASTIETYLALSLDAFYKDNMNVEVDHRPITRKYYKWGKNLIGFSHGELPLKNYAKVLPFEAKEFFSDCEHFEILVGDKHIEEVYKTPVLDDEGIIVRRLAALTKTDRWHFNSTFNLSKRRSYILYYDKYKGLELQYINQAD